MTENTGYFIFTTINISYKINAFYFLMKINAKKSFFYDYIIGF